MEKISITINPLAFFLNPTSNEEVQGFIKKLKPYSTEHPLVRIGPKYDGGYLLPNDLAGIKNCYSPGVGTSSNFELHLAEMGIRSFMADASVDGPSTAHPLFSFEKKFLGAEDEGDHITLKSWVNGHTPEDENLILQMDIEGAEYPVIHSAPEETLKKFRVIVIEFHDLHYIWNRSAFEFLNTIFGKLLKHFVVIHLHPNNYEPGRMKDGIIIPPVLEITLLRKDRVKHLSPSQSFPHPLDFDNATHLPPFPLPRSWYQN